MDVSTAPILYATLAAACFGGQVVVTMRSFAHVDPQTSSMISIGTCVAVYWLLSPFLLKTAYLTNPGTWIFFMNGLIHPLFSIYLAFEATKRMGPTVAATISATAPLFATAGAVLALGEQVTVMLLLGTVGTVAGVMILSWNRHAHRHWALWMLIFPMGAAVIRGTNHILGKVGLEMVPSSYYAGLVSFTVSFFGSVLIYYLRMGRLPLVLPLKGLLWSAPAGLLIAIGILSMYSALNCGRVVVVSPIIAAFPLFTLGISLLFRQERFRLRILLGVVLVIGGIVWISVQ
ncbi:MAG: DMT family transporter [Desulfobacteraceae bacterium]